MSVRLERDPATKMVSGVCAGLAQYLRLDVALVRLFFVASTLLGGFGVLVYLVLLVIMPTPGNPGPAGDPAQIGRDLGDAATAAGVRLQEALRPASTDQRRSTAGLVLVGLGILFLASNLGLLRVDSRVFWPLVLILLGAWLLVRRSR